MKIIISIYVVVVRTDEVSPATGLGGSGGEREIFVSEADGGGKCKVGGSHTTREHRRGARSPRL